MKRQIDAVIADDARAQASLSGELEQVGVCDLEGCGNPIYRNPRGGARAKRCASCRARLGGVGSKRGANAGTRGRSTSREPAEVGPIIAVRRLVASLPSDQRPGGVMLHVSVAAVALTGATGLPEQVGEHIVEAMQVLVEQGESGEDIRRRLNPNPFGRLDASRARSVGGLMDYLEEAESA